MQSCFFPPVAIRIAAKAELSNPTAVAWRGCGEDQSLRTDSACTEVGDDFASSTLVDTTWSKGFPHNVIKRFTVGTLRLSGGDREAQYSAFLNPIYCAHPSASGTWASDSATLVIYIITGQTWPCGSSLWYLWKPITVPSIELRHGYTYWVSVTIALDGQDQPGSLLAIETRYGYIILCLGVNQFKISVHQMVLLTLWWWAGNAPYNRPLPSLTSSWPLTLLCTFRS